ncbi:hypothetical protein HYW83_01830 [Candidatus Peregrinibacteria bacterium]|nr:hypothetical protein [Candidatus Peregrinibacteria bacterium]
MDGRAWFVVAAFLMAAVMVLSNTSCGYDEPWPPQQNIVGGADSLAVDSLTNDELCIETAPEAGKEVIFSAPNGYGTCEDDGMEAASAADTLFFTVSEDSPQQVTLYGRPSVQYCFLVLRKSGYITISHPNGVVHREGDLFEWCVVAEDGEPEYMIIRSLTPSASFTLAAKE